MPWPIYPYKIYASVSDLLKRHLRVYSNFSSLKNKGPVNQKCLFFQKLLERTQARKEQLAKKREELAACRAKRNPTARDHQRRPLSEDNKDSKSCDAEESKKRKLSNEGSIKDTLKEKVKSAPPIDANSPSIQVFL